MKMAKSKEEQIFVGIDDQVIELTGADKEAFLSERKLEADAKALLETEQLAKQTARASAITKLAEIAGLTEEEINAII
jgi:hypothetical protein